MRAGAKRSKPAATAVWVVKRFPARVAANATSSCRPDSFASQFRGVGEQLRHRVHDRLRAIILEVKDGSRGPQIVLSRPGAKRLHVLIRLDPPAAAAGAAGTGDDLAAPFAARAWDVHLQEGLAHRDLAVIDRAWRPRECD